jgi:4-hydroxybenzoate polyprenyltransferase/phosphoserine phosphatase
VVQAESVGRRRLPLAVDLDGTLLKTDLLWETLLVLIKHKILLLFWIPIWLIHGKARLKLELAKRTKINARELPFHQEFLSFLQSEHKLGRNLILTSGTDQHLAQSIAQHLGIFSEVLASDGQVNLTGNIKSGVLVEKYGERGFDYAGNESADLAVWNHANAALVVNPSSRLIRSLRKSGEVRLFDDRKKRLPLLFQALRIKHWLKNILIFVPLLTSHRWSDLSAVLSTILAFLAFSLAASSVYVINDLLDLHNDRSHPSKKNRPFAAGELSITTGILTCVVLLLSSVGLSALLPAGLGAVLAIYFGLNLIYSFYFKQVVLVDVLLLAVFYALRVSAGGVATGIMISQWLLIFSVFIFLSLASGKRVSELYALKKNNSEEAIGRGYTSRDLEQLATQGTAAGFIAVLISALYIYSPAVTVLYTSPQILWLICPLQLYWISRFWLLVQRGEIHEDPIVFVIKDKVSLLVGLLIMLVMLSAT